jgi:RNA polymerase sigma factor (sigma-70 family)
MRQTDHHGFDATHSEAAPPVGGPGALVQLYGSYLSALTRTRESRPASVGANGQDTAQAPPLQASVPTGKLENTRGQPSVACLRHLLVLGLAGLIHGPEAAQQQRPSAGPSAARSRSRHPVHVLAAQLARLPPACREVVRLRNLQGLSFDRVARRMGLTPRAVRQLWLRGLAQLDSRQREEYQA